METERLRNPARHDRPHGHTHARIERSHRTLRVAVTPTVPQLTFPHLLTTGTTLWFAVSLANRMPGKLLAAFLALSVTFMIGALLDHRLRRTVRAFVSKKAWGTSILVLAALLVGLIFFWGAIPSWSLLIPFVVAGIATAPIAEICHRTIDAAGDGGTEMIRATVAAIFALWVIAPFATSGQVGAGDALHYVRQLADFVDQLKAGIFPILIGKGSHAFNGDVHPLRTAPMYQYVGAFVHAATGGQGTAFVVHNLVMAGTYLASVAVTYACLLNLAPRRGWLRLVLILLFASSPGILALSYGGDMVASWLTIPFLPLFFFLLVRLAMAPDPDRWLVGLAACCAALWYAHAPIALWTSAIAAPVALTRLVQAGLSSRALVRTALACGLFSILTFFLFVSVKDLQIPRSLPVLEDFSGGTVLRNLEIGWSGFLRPASKDGAALISDLQLSPGLWLAFIPAAAAAVASGYALRALVTGFVLLLLLLVPWPAISGTLWSLVPDAMLLPTEKWPMQRFYPIMTALAVILAARFLPSGSNFPRAHRILFMLVALGATWSAVEARKFVHRGHATSTPEDVAFRRLLPENSTLSRYSHEYYGPPTRYFSNSTVNPAYQMRLLNPSTLEPEQSNYDIPTPLNETITLQIEPHPTGSARILPNVILEPGRRYLLTFDFKPGDPSGWIILSGKTFYRDYQLPHSGSERAFGSGPLSARAIVMETSGNKPESVEINYLWNSGPPAGDIFAKIQFGPEAEGAVPFRVTSLIPFRTELRGVHEGLIMTPRIFLPGYLARIDGREVETQPNARQMLMVPVTKGAKELTLTFVGTPILRISFWMSFCAWLAVGCWLAVSARTRLAKTAAANEHRLV